MLSFHYSLNRPQASCIVATLHKWFFSVLECASIPIGYSTTLKEKHQPIKEVIEKINYATNYWKICMDLKMINFLLGLQSDYTKHLCFLCLRKSRIKHQHWVRKYWPPRQQMTVGEDNVLYEPLVPCDKIILTPLHVKLRLMKQFAKALDKEGVYFEYICKSFPGVTIEKIKLHIRRSRYQKTYERSELYY